MACRQSVQRNRRASPQLAHLGDITAGDLERWIQCQGLIEKNESLVELSSHCEGDAEAVECREIVWMGPKLL